MEQFKYIKEKGKFSNYLYMAAYISIEMKNPQSPYRNFLDTWPSSTDEFPIMFDKKRLELLKGTTLERFVEQRTSQLSAEHKIL